MQSINARPRTIACCARRSQFLHDRSLRRRRATSIQHRPCPTHDDVGARPRERGAAAANRTIWRDELIDTIKLALPIALTQLGQVAMMTSDLALLGRLGDHVVAASALAHTVLFAAFMVGMGIVSAVSPLASQAFGARQPRMVRRALRVGLWAATIARHSAQRLAALRRADPAGARPDAGRRGARRELSEGAGLVPGAGVVVHRAARLHAIGEPARARRCGSRLPRSRPTRCSPMR